MSQMTAKIILTLLIIGLSGGFIITFIAKLIAKLLDLDYKLEENFIDFISIIIIITTIISKFFLPWLFSIVIGVGVFLGFLLFLYLMKIKK